MTRPWSIGRLGRPWAALRAACAAARLPELRSDWVHAGKIRPRDWVLAGKIRPTGWVAAGKKRQRLLGWKAKTLACRLHGAHL